MTKALDRCAANRSKGAKPNLWSSIGFGAVRVAADVDRAASISGYASLEAYKPLIEAARLILVGRVGFEPTTS